MKRLFPIATLIAASCAPVAPAPETAPPAPPAAPAPQAPGAMDPARTIAANLATSPDHRTLTAALRAAGLETTLAAAGSNTLFAPTDAAFAKLPTGALEALMVPASAPELRRLLNDHLVAGRHEAKSATLRGVEGGTLILSEGAVIDGNGNRAAIVASAPQANGIVHVIDVVLAPAR